MEDGKEKWLVQGSFEESVTYIFPVRDLRYKPPDIVVKHTAWTWMGAANYSVHSKHVLDQTKLMA